MAAIAQTPTRRSFKPTTLDVPTARFDASAWSGTAPLAVTFDASSTTDGGSTITSLTLQFGDGQSVTWSNKSQTQSHTYTSGGTFNACLTATNAQGTSSSTCGAITVSGATEWPIARFDASAWSGTAPLTVQFDPSSSTGDPITSLTLQFGDGQSVTWSSKSQRQSHTYTSAGTFNACLTATNSQGTSQPTCGAITVSGATEWPIARFDASVWSGTAPLAVQFNASSTTGDPITSLTLQFGDGQSVTWSSKSQTQSHTYTSAGTFNACLTATNSQGTSQPTCGAITVTGGATEWPVARFDASAWSGSAPLTVQFDPSSTTGDPITSLTLQFGDGQSVTWSSKSQKQSHTYTSGGSFNACLTATNSQGTSNPTCGTIQVTGNPGDISSLPPGGLAIPTFHSVSLYYNPPSDPGSDDEVQVRYRSSDETSWHEALPLWYDRVSERTNSQFTPYPYSARGSVVFLRPGTPYIFQFGVNGQWLNETQTTTWSDPLPADNANVVTIPPVQGTFVIHQNEGGTASAYKVYDGSANPIAFSGVETTQKNCVRVEAPYVIVRNVTCSGAYYDGIAVAAGVNDVVIEDNDISQWDYYYETKPKWDYNIGGNEVSGIKLEGNNAGVVIQRNKIHDPMYGSFPWDIEHPRGPMGIFVDSGAGQNVIRYNEIYASNPSDLSHWLQDGISGGLNFSDLGSPGADSDIYSNQIRNVFDDAIEAEGGGRNVRVWGNYMDETGPAVATTIVHWGPMYVFRNISNHVRFKYLVDPSQDSNRPPAFKAYGQDDGFGGGREYFFNNTLLQPGGNLGAGGGIGGGYNPLEYLHQVRSLNNIFHLWSTSAQAIDAVQPDDTVKAGHDLYNGRLNAVTEDAGVPGVPTYATNSAPVRGGTSEGWFQLSGSSDGAGHAQRIPNFTDDIENTALALKSGIVPSATSNIGAHDPSQWPMLFGIAAWTQP